MLVFFVAQGVYINRFLPDESTPDAGAAGTPADAAEPHKH